PQVTIAGTTQRADATLLFFRRVPAGAHMVTLAGDPWMTVNRPVKVDAGAIAIVSPLVARIGTALRVHWSRGSAMPHDRDCDDKPAKPLPLTLTLLACPDETSARCTEITARETPRDMQSGIIEFPGVAAGAYALRAAKFEKRIRIAADKANDVDFEIRYAPFFGRVTRGGKPMHPRLFGTATEGDNSGYTAALLPL